MKWLATLFHMILPDNHQSEKLYKYEVPLKRDVNYSLISVSLKPFIDDFFEDILQSYTQCFGRKAKLNGQKAITQTAAICILRREEYHSTILFQLVFDELMVRAKTLGYYLTYSTIQIEETEHQKKEVELYYLKAYPGESVDGYKHNQLWGQLFLEHHFIDEESSFIKIRCNYYLGRNYTEPLSFDDLIFQLCTHTTT